MAYTKKTWADDAAGGTPITAAELNRMEDGIDGSAKGSQGAVLQLMHNGTAYPAKSGPAGSYYIFVGPDDPNALGLMADGDTWRDTTP